MGEKLKAYVVTDEYGEGHATVEFAAHNIVARREGARYLDLEFEAVSCRRASEFDSYSDKGYVPPLVLIEHGWWFLCFHCGQRLSGDAEDDDGNPLPASAMIEDGSECVFCNAACRDAHAQRVQAQNDRFTAFKERIAKLRPDLSFREHRGQWPNLTCFAVFGFPGCKYGGSVREDDGELSWMVAYGDHDAWESYEAQRTNAALNAGPGQ